MFEVGRAYQHKIKQHLYVNSQVHVCLWADSRNALLYGESAIDPQLHYQQSFKEWEEVCSSQ